QFLAPVHERRTLFAADVDVVEHPIELLARDDGPDLNLRVETIPDVYGAAELAQPCDEFALDAALNEEACASGAHLAGVVVHRHRRTRHCCIQVGVGEYDVGRLPPQFELQSFHIDRRG